MRRKAPYLILAGLLVAADQVTKFLVAARIFQGQTVTVIPGFFNLVHVHNRGAIFGLLSQSVNPWVRRGLLAASLAALVFVIYYFARTPAAEKGVLVGLTLILSGALGNQVNRLWPGYVVDFLDLHIGGAHWPFFNVADSCITIGGVWLLITFVFRRRS